MWAWLECRMMLLKSVLWVGQSMSELQKKSSASKSLDIQSDLFQYEIRIWILFLIFSNALMHLKSRSVRVSLPNNRSRIRPLASPTVTEPGQIGLVTWESRLQVVAAADPTRLDIAAPSPRKVPALLVWHVASKTCASERTLSRLCRPRHAKNLTWVNPNCCKTRLKSLLIPHCCSRWKCVHPALSDVDIFPALDGHRKFLPQLNFPSLSAGVSVFLVHSEHLWHCLPPICSYGYPMRRRTAALFFIASFVMTSSCRIFHCEEK